MKQTRHFNLLDWCASSELLRDQSAKQICMDQSSEKMQLICHIRDESRELLPSMAPRSEAMHRLWKELPRHRAKRRS